MRSCRELQRETWKVLKGKWLLRLFAVAVLLQGILTLVDRLLTAAFDVRRIHPLGEFVVKKGQALAQGMDYALPSTADYGWMLGGAGLRAFLFLVFSGVATFGITAFLLKAREDDDSRWFASAFGGFARPFGAAGLLLLVHVRVFLWTLLLVVPGVVAMYRYRLAWFLKVERPDRTATDCLATSSEMMKGRKWTAFRLDMAFLGWIFLSALVAVAGGLVGSAFPGWAGGLVSFFVAAVGFYYVVKASFGLAVSHAVFYRELETDAEE